MNIAHVADSVEVGGAEVMMATLIRFQRAEGHRVTIHCLYAEGPLAEELRQMGVEIFMHGPAPAITAMRSMLRVFRKERPDVLHCHNAAAAIFGAPLARLLPKRPVVLCTRHGLVDRRPRQEFKFWIASRLFCDTVVAVCDAGRRNMAAHKLSDPTKIVVVRNGATAAPAVVTAKKEPHTGLVLINVARLSAEKDHMTLLRAVAIASQKVQDLRLWIVGDGKLRSQLSEFVANAGLSNCVSFLGEQKDVGTYLAQADAFVLSSVSEGLPISILEAMAARLPILSTRVGGMVEIGDLMPRACELVPLSDPEAMAAAICRFSADRSELPKRGAVALECYREYFTPAQMAQTYMNLYRGCRLDPKAPVGSPASITAAGKVPK